ncbi:uncharacterized protein LOC130759084 isoform X2 [Actinidia eriantha]|uniref:uncharacterized protein LOC130759084 isoform X2 n=1 Tax=Actinidia eriantha TaxID=165200 RepID=UPI00258E3F7F|nr:uncharacterized protein LOC130759084 isoform X2 [Actinidia eriantha]
MGLIIGDHFDCAYDEKLARQLKRRRHNIMESEINDSSHTLKRILENNRLGKGMMDKEYVTFLNHLMEYFESRFSVRDDGDNGDDIDEGDDVDPDYKMFLQELREDENSYVLKTVYNNMALSFKYESKVGLDDEHEPPTLRKSRRISDTEKREAAKKMRDLQSKDKMDTQKNMRYVASKGMMGSTENTGNVKGKERRNSEVEKDLKSGPVKHVSGKKNGPSCQKPSPMGNEHETVADMIDEDYQIFLHGLKEENAWYTFETKDGNKVTYEGPVVQNSSNSEVYATDNASDFNKGHYNPFETSRLFTSLMEEDEWQCIGNPSAGKSSVFRQKLMGKLREPYDQEEYKKLWEMINDRTPKDGRHRDLRGAASLKSYLKDECNPSYLEHYSGLKKKIDAAKVDRHKLLNLLRGFFFWLENLVYEDAFCPWLDSSCLAVMPRNR